jgi:hypothetical protein
MFSCQIFQVELKERRELRQEVVQFAWVLLGDYK